jgi:hypothetical protein
VHAEDIPLQYEFVASNDTARQMTRALMRWSLRTTKWAGLVGLFAVLTLIFFAMTSDAHWIARLLAASIVSGIFTIAAFVIVLTFTYVVSRRQFGHDLPAGEVIRTGFGQTAFVYLTSVISTRRPYDTIRSIDTCKRFVVVRYKPGPQIRVYPEAVFPPEIVDYLRSRRG